MKSSLSWPKLQPRYDFSLEKSCPNCYLLGDTGDKPGLRASVYLLGRNYRTPPTLHTGIDVEGGTANANSIMQLCRGLSSVKNLLRLKAHTYIRGVNQAMRE